MVEQISLLHELVQPMRYKIIQTLAQARKPLYIGEIAKRIGVDRREVSFHLAALAEHGLVEGEWRVIEAPKSKLAKGKAAKYYKPTQRTLKVLSEFSDELSKLMKAIEVLLKEW